MKLIFGVCLIFIILIINPFFNVETAYYHPQKHLKYPEFLIQNFRWIDSIFSTLTPRERIAQLFMVDAYSKPQKNNRNYIEKLIKDYNIGGIIFMQGTPEYQVDLTNRYQKLSKTPLLIGMDAERGVGFRLKKIKMFPSQMTLSATNNSILIENIGKEIARQCKRLGVHVNFAPVADINDNIDNPVINNRSFGDDKKTVTKNANAIMKGLQSERLIAVAKHFPGHGNTTVDSHHDLPKLNFTYEKLDTVELYPFKKLIKNNIAGIMTAHLNIPVLDTINRVGSLSPNVVDKLLKQKLGFQGLIFTDALNMKGVTEYVETGEAELKALLAGNDILLFSKNVKKSIETIESAVENGLISQNEIDRRVKKILKAKLWVGLDSISSISKKNLVYDLNSKNAQLFQLKAIEDAVCLIKNENDLIPLKGIDTFKILNLNIGAGIKYFQHMLYKYTWAKNVYLSKNVKYAYLKKIKKLNKKRNLIILNIYSNKKNKDYGITEPIKRFIEEIEKDKLLIINYFGIPYGISEINNLSNIDAIIVAHNNSKDYQKVAAQIIFGGLPSKGILPVKVHDSIVKNTGIKTEEIRLGYTRPELVGMNSRKLYEISRIIKEAIRIKATPGANILIARNGKIIFNNQYGYHTYDKKRRVKISDLYDIASVTKIVGTLPIIMKLYEDKELKLDDNIGKYVKWLRYSDKNSLLLKDILTHQAGLLPWIFYYQHLIDESSYTGKLYSNKKTKVHSKKVFKNLYMDENFDFKKNVFSTKKKYRFNKKVGDSIYISKKYSDSIFYIIKETDLLTSKYRYSDLGLILMVPLVERITKQKFDKFLDKNFLKKLRTKTLTFNPLEKYDEKRIIPTAKDYIIRNKLVHGYVHDLNAALMGGISGHAGLFSNAEDLAKVLQMFLYGGEYGGVRFLNEETLGLFTSRAYPDSVSNRRGLGFDKPQIDTTLGSPVTRLVSPESYGHSGFTGILVWVDPTYDLIYVFLSNRVYPDEWRKKLIKLNIRTKIHEKIYESIIDDENDFFKQISSENLNQN